MNTQEARSSQALFQSPSKLINKKLAFANTSKSIVPCLALAAALILFLPLNSDAYQTVRVNGNLYACENSCNVNYYKDGSYSVQDSAGGWAARIETDGGVIVELPPEQ